METPSKKLEISTMTHEEEEEMQHDISKLQDQVQNISLSQREKKIELKGDMDGLRADIEDKLDGLKNDVEAKIDGIQEKLEGLTKLLEENIPNGEKVVEETHYENKINVNHDFINSNVGLKTHHIPRSI